MIYQEEKATYEPQSPCLKLFGSLDRTRPSGLGFGTYTPPIRRKNRQEKTCEFNVNNYIQSPMFEHFF